MSSSTQPSIRSVAIVGMAGRFPGAAGVDEFWSNLRNGVESIVRLSDEQLDAAGVSRAQRQHVSFVNAGAVVDGVDMFDAGFFGFNPREAEITDPQQRLFLECAWQALEDAGYDPDRYEGLIGVYAGSGMNTYLINNLVRNPRAVLSVGAYQTMIGNDKDFLTTRVSYKLNLKGPSFAVQTACSTSLVAVHLACESLLNHRCDMALAGGVSVLFPQGAGYQYQDGMILSPDGHCRAFDADAQGTVSGGGAGIVVLKRLDEALRDGDTIYATIRGSAINNDGALKVGYTAPSVEGQADVIAEALAFAGVAPETVQYVEAHGTATPLGDPIEISALTQVFRSSTDRKQFCAIGSLKSNIGHLDSAAGVAGLIKTALALRHRQIPPSLQFKRPNPKLDLDNSPFFVNAELTDWHVGTAPRRAGVSSFGIGGTNAHVVLEEAPSRPAQPAPSGAQLLVVSARSRTALDAACDRLRGHLEQHSDLNLADVAHTLQTGRRAFAFRRAIVCQDAADAIAALGDRAGKPVLAAIHNGGARTCAFLFSGQGSQYVDMAVDLYRRHPRFREEFDRCCDLLQPHLGLDLRGVLYPAEEERAAAATQLEQTRLAQPAIFAVEYSLARLWMSCGVQPDAMLGHSIGEYVAACLAGVFRLDEALALVAARGRVMQELASGAMLAVSVPETQVTPLLDGSLSIAAVNAPNLCVVSGPTEAIGQLEARLSVRGVAHRRLHTSHAFHSAMMEPALEAFGQEVARVGPRPPAIPYISNVTGTWITDDQATDPTYWTTHLRRAVRFSDGVRTLLEDPARILLEVGPGNVLTTLARHHIARDSDHMAVASMRHPQETASDETTWLTATARLWLAGVPIDWTAVHPEPRRRVPLPTYPFERQRYWVDPLPDSAVVSAPPISLAKAKDIADWFYLPTWKQTPCPPLAAASGKDIRWIVFEDETGLGEAVTAQLRADGRNVTALRMASDRRPDGGQALAIDPEREEHYHEALRSALGSGSPVHIVHLWGVGTTEQGGAGDFQTHQERGFFSLLNIARVLAVSGKDRAVSIEVVTSHVQDVTGHEPIVPGRATVLGAATVIAQELPSCRCRSIDVEPARQGADEKRLAKLLIAEAASAATEPVVAYRGERRWVQAFDRMPLPAEATAMAKDEGVYLITGGLGGVGLALAEHLARTHRARLVLMSRTALPPRDQWRSLAEQDSAASDDVVRKIRRLISIAERGGQVLALAGDVANESDVRRVVAAAIDHFGGLDGVIHAAGLLPPTGFRLLSDMTCEDAEQHFRPKVLGTLVLDKVLGDRNLDFCLLISSISCVLGGVAYSAYAAANHFLDAFAASVTRATRRVPWVIANWDGWNFGVDSNDPLMQLTMTPSEGVETIARVLPLDPPRRVVISTGDLPSRLERWVVMPESVSAQPEGRHERHARPDVRTDYVAPDDETTRTLAEMWEEVLGIGGIGVHDDFFELGGHSLLATQLISRMQARLQVDVPLRTFFEATTIRQLSERVNTMQWMARGSELLPASSSDTRDEIAI